jgi:hypothetical protein
MLPWGASAVEAVAIQEESLAYEEIVSPRRRFERLPSQPRLISTGQRRVIRLSLNFENLSQLSRYKRERIDHDDRQVKQHKK